ncbi:diguanylate cyclase [Oxynema sp. CENA135]|uniref:diguanylate cyclase n=1 Tax=Oxynema sp. CENA135 TaxID=984206 RepID=UPI00190C9BF2|nr:diguanylate cyclase [Oxynema sp. CENA135]MBK4730106.1 diguanylate cyclase [Oxynema sp. CENA135]
MFVPLLKQAIEPHPLTVSTDTTIEETIALMSRTKASCVLVVDRPHSEIGDAVLVGIFTERDVVRKIALGDCLSGISISEVMTREIVTLQESPSQDQDIVTILSLFRQHRIRHLPVLSQDGKLLGLMTHQSIRSVLKPIDFMRLRRVGEVMSQRVIHAPPTSTVLHLAHLMNVYHVSCVAIAEPLDDRSLPPAEDDNLSVWSADSCQLKAVRPIGIVTERDILQFRNLGLDFEQVRASTVMSAPLFPIRRENSLWEAHQQMQNLRVQRLVVRGDRDELVGIITQTSLLQGLDPMEMYAEIEVLQELLQQSEAERQSLLEQLIARNKLLESLALTDELTGLPNRRAMEQARPQIVPSDGPDETGYSYSYIALFVIDVDYFKRVNDTYGHAIGDAILQKLAKRLQDLARPQSWFYRYGGEEFVCVTLGMLPEAAIEYGESLRQAIAEQPIATADGLEIAIAISIGGAIAKVLSSQDRDITQLVDTQALFQKADEALYQAKREGRNCLRMSPIQEISWPSEISIEKAW